MARIEINETPTIMGQSSSSEIPTQRKPSLKILKAPGISYYPDKIEIAEDRVLMTKLNREMLDYVTVLSQLLDLMHMVKIKHLKNSNPIPLKVIIDMITQPKSQRLKKYDLMLNDSAVTASPSVEAVLKTLFPFQPVTGRPRNVSKEGKATSFPYANDLLEITGKKVRPIWQTVILEKPEEISVLQRMKKQKKSKRLESSGSDRINTERCKIHQNLKRTKSETSLFSIKFAFKNIDTPDMADDKQLHHQMEMMIASHAGFRTVDEHKAYLSTLQSHWYTNFLHDAVDVGTVSCDQSILAFQNLAKHYDMNYNSLPLAKAKLCLIVMSLPFWSIARTETQRAVEFILENILLLTEKSLPEWLKVRGIPYVVFPAFSAEDFMGGHPEKEIELEEETGDEEERELAEMEFENDQ